MVMRLGSTTAIARTSHECNVRRHALSFKLSPMYPMAFAVIRHDMSSFTHDPPHRALHSLTLAISQPTVQDRRRIESLDMHMTAQLDDNGNFDCEQYFDCRRSLYWPFLDALFAFIVAQRPLDIHHNPLSPLIDYLADYGDEGETSRMRNIVRCVKWALRENRPRGGRGGKYKTKASKWGVKAGEDCVIAEGIAGGRGRGPRGRGGGLVTENGAAMAREEGAEPAGGYGDSADDADDEGEGDIEKWLSTRMQAIGTKGRRRVPSMATPRRTSREKGPRATREKMELAKLAKTTKSAASECRVAGANKLRPQVDSGFSDSEDCTNAQKVM